MKRISIARHAFRTATLLMLLVMSGAQAAAKSPPPEGWLCLWFEWYCES